MSREKDFSAEMTTTCKKLGYDTHKISDTPFINSVCECVNCGKNTPTGNVSFGSHKKPFDRLINIEGDYYAIEEKISDANSFSLSKLKPGGKQEHQVKFLSNAKRGYFIINYRFTHKEKGVINCVVVLSGHSMKEIIASGKKSIQLFDEKGNQQYKAYRKVKGVWYLPFFKLSMEAPF
jgi:hypothetical protein